MILTVEKPIAVKGELVVKDFSDLVVVERVKGVRLRIVVRGGIVVKVEKWVEPGNKQRNAGVSVGWYDQIREQEQQNKLYFDCVKNIVFNGESLIDGEWEGIACGPKIGENEMQVAQRCFYIKDWIYRWFRLDFFSKNPVILTGDGKVDEGLLLPRIREYCKETKSLVGTNQGLLGLEFWGRDVFSYNALGYEYKEFTSFPKCKYYYEIE